MKLYLTKLLIIFNIIIIIEKACSVGHGQYNKPLDYSSNF